MKLVGRIPVEPLDDERLTNIERRIVAGAQVARPIERESRTMQLALVFAVVCVLVLGAGVVGYKLNGSGDPQVVAESTQLHVDHQTLDIGDARITGDANTVFTVTRPGGGVLVSLSRGRVELQVDKRGPRPPLVVRAGDTDVEVIGTRFSVDYGDGTGGVDVRVTEGVVRVVHQHQTARVAAGEVFTTRPAIVADATAQKPDAAIDMGKTPDVGLHERHAKVPDAHVTTSGTIVTPRQLPKPTPTLDPGDANADLKKLIRSQAVAPAADIGTLDLQTALTKYRAIVIDSAKRGEEASAALYSIAYVQYMKQGHESEALATLEAFLKRFRGGKEYLPALWLRVRITCLRSNVEADCRRAAYAYVEAAGDSEQRRIADRLKTEP